MSRNTTVSGSPVALTSRVTGSPRTPSTRPPLSSGNDMSATPTLTLPQLNAAAQAEFAALLDGTYEHSPWVAEAAWPKRPFASLAQLKLALVEVLRAATPEAQLKLIRAHP